MGCTAHGQDLTTVRRRYRSLSAVVQDGGRWHKREVPTFALWRVALCHCCLGPRLRPLTGDQPHSCCPYCGGERVSA